VALTFLYPYIYILHQKLCIKNKHIK